MAESVEFEHFIGLNSISNGTLFHPNGQKCIFSNGGNLIIGDLIDPHSQSFLRKHDDTITCIALSGSGRLVASGQKGENADIFIWDYDSQEVLYRFEEHDHLIQAVAFSDDERIFTSLGDAEEDGKLIVWDLSNGCIIAACTQLPPGTCCMMFGGFVKDIKRRDTSHYLLCTAGMDGLVLWDLDPYSGDFLPQKLLGDARATISRHVTDVAFSEDKEYLYGATTSGDYIIASIRSMRIVQAVQATKMRLNAIISYNYGVAIACGDSTIKVYNRNADLVGQIRLDGDVLGLSSSPDKLEVLAGTSMGSIARVNLNSLQHILISESHTGAVLKVAFDQGGHNERFATVSLDGTIRVWDLVEYSVIATAHPRREQGAGCVPLCLAFTNILISGWSDGSVLAHSAETGDNLWMLTNAHQGGVTALVLSHNRRFVLTGGPEGEVRLWELRSRELISHLKEHRQKVTCLALFEDDTLALSGSRDRCILRWDLKREIRVHCHMQRMGGINDLVISLDQMYTISVGQDRKILVWHNGYNDIVTSLFLDQENDEGNAIAMSHDGRMLATGGTAGILRLWSLTLPTQEQPTAHVSVQFLCQARGHSKTIHSLAFSFDDKQIVSVGEDGGIFVWTVFAA